MKEILFLVTVFLTNIIQCVTGFAGTVLAMPVSVILVGFGTAKPILNIMGLLASVWVAAFNFRNINRKEFAKIMGIMFIGMAAGIYIRPYFESNVSLLYKTLGAIVILFAVMNAVKFYTGKEEKHIPEPLSIVLLLVAGTVHGMFVCGGPLLVTYAGEKMRDKNEFRATLSAVWVVLNSIILATDIHAGYFNGNVIKLTVISTAVLAAALVLGNLIAKKLSRSVFLQLTYILMLISGILLFIK